MADNENSTVTETGETTVFTSETNQGAWNRHFCCCSRLRHGAAQGGCCACAPPSGHRQVDYQWAYP